MTERGTYSDKAVFVFDHGDGGVVDCQGDLADKRKGRLLALGENVEEWQSGTGLAELHHGIRTSTLEVVAVPVESVIMRLTRGPADRVGRRNRHALGHAARNLTDRPLAALNRLAWLSCRNAFGLAVDHLAFGPVRTVAAFTGACHGNTLGPAVDNVADSARTAVRFVTGRRVGGHTLWASADDLTHGPCLAKYGGTRGRRIRDAMGLVAHGLAHCSRLAFHSFTGSWNRSTGWSPVHHFAKGTVLAVYRMTRMGGHAQRPPLNHVAYRSLWTAH